MPNRRRNAGKEASLLAASGTNSLRRLLSRRDSLCGLLRTGRLLCALDAVLGSLLSTLGTFLFLLALCPALFLRLLFVLLLLLSRGSDAVALVRLITLSCGGRLSLLYGGWAGIPWVLLAAA